MKKVLILTVALTLVLGGIAFAGVSGSKHDLTAGSRDGSISGANGQGRTDQVCVFCHHPHRKDATGGQEALLWNRSIGSESATYATYSAANVTGDNLGAINTYAKHTRLCLSCHDSGYNATAVNTAPAAFTGTFTANYNVSGNQTDIAGDTGGLTNDHPVDFSYTYVQGVNSEFPAPGATSGNVTVGSNTWVLYGGTMQCGTCHEPHTDTTSAGVQFIRNATTNPLSGSTMCSDCHANH